MSPTILRVGSYRFFFNSREESRGHVHAATPEGLAEFWLKPIVAWRTTRGSRVGNYARQTKVPDDVIF